ncbi:metal ABC transporter permease [Porphyromonas pogonae]|nr:metal ABC transporter permease [Porphyromonas pogonae]
MTSILSYQFFQNALWASLFTAIVCGLVGSYIVVRRMVFISGGITHASFGGLGLGLYLGFDPMLGAGAFAVLSALGIAKASETETIREDSAIAGVWSLGMALGVLFMTLTPGYSTNLASYLFGNILLVTTQDLIALALMALLMTIAFVVFYRPILYTAFDPDFARTKGVRVKLIETLMFIAIAIGIVLSIRLVGIMLLMSLLTLPQTIMNLYTYSFRKMLVGSVIIALCACVAGLLGSYYWGLPSGAFIILVLVTLFIFAKVGTSLRHFKVKTI